MSVTKQLVYSVVFEWLTFKPHTFLYLGFYLSFGLFPCLLKLQLQFKKKQGGGGGGNDRQPSNLVYVYMYLVKLLF